MAFIYDMTACMLGVSWGQGRGGGSGKGQHYMSSRQAGDSILCYLLGGFVLGWGHSNMGMPRYVKGTQGVGAGLVLGGGGFLCRPIPVRWCKKPFSMH
jgi:hypothetical protein